MGSQNWGSQNPKQSLTSLFWEGPMILSANKNSEDEEKNSNFLVCISKLPWFHCCLVQVLLKHYISSLVFFFLRQLPTQSFPPKNWLLGRGGEGLQCGRSQGAKNGLGLGKFHPLGTTNHVTPRFFVLFFFFGGWLFGGSGSMVDFFSDFCFQSGMSESEWVTFLFFGTQECQNGFCMRRQWCPAENANWVPPPSGELQPCSSPPAGSCNPVPPPQRGAVTLFLPPSGGEVRRGGECLGLLSGFVLPPPWPSPRWGEGNKARAAGGENDKSPSCWRREW